MLIKDLCRALQPQNWKDRIYQNWKKNIMFRLIKMIVTFYIMFIRKSCLTGTARHGQMWSGLKTFELQSEKRKLPCVSVALQLYVFCLLSFDPDSVLQSLIEPKMRLMLNLIKEKVDSQGTVL